MSSALTTSAAPTPQPSILRLPSEVRQTIFRHLFADSEVVIGDKYDGEVWKVHQSLEVAVLLSCKQLCLEAQGPLASLTRLVIADQDYCTSHIFTPVFLTYVPRIEHLTLYLGRCKLATTFDARAMPALKVLHLRRAHEVDSSMEYQPEDLHIDQWDDFYEGREDKFVINKWRRWVEFEYKRGPSESSGGVRWLQRLASKPCGSPFSIMVQYSCRVDFQKAGDFGQTRYMIMEISFDAATEQIQQRKVLDDSTDWDVSSGREDDQIDRYLLDNNESGARIDKIRASDDFYTWYY